METSRCGLNIVKGRTFDGTGPSDSSQYYSFLITVSADRYPAGPSRSQGLARTERGKSGSEW